MTPAVKRFERCVACGTAVQAAYRTDDFQFLLKVFNSPIHLELVSGLDQLQATATEMDLREFDDNESVSSI
uniref:Uncharacterized protein n=1 Tax=Setaria digitata TaxID=48799 RepID=A0A915PV96_9BILA